MQPKEGELLSDEDSARINRIEEKEVSSSRKAHHGSLQKDEREDLIREAMSRMQDLIVKTGFVETANLLQKQLAENKAINEKLMESTRKKGNKNFEQILPNNATSEVTIYQNAVANEIGKKDSTSSEEDVNNISDEIDPRNSAEFSDLNSQRGYPPLNRDYYANGEGPNNIDVMISEVRNNSQERVRQGDMVREVPQRRNLSQMQSQYVDDGQKPGTSREEHDFRAQHYDDRGKQIILEAEAGRARIHETPGEFVVKYQDNGTPKFKLDLNRDFVHSAMVDEGYQVVASHLDENTQGKIMRGEYVDFGRLIPRD